MLLCGFSARSVGPAVADYQVSWHSVAVADRDQASLLYLIKRLELAVRKQLDAVVAPAGLTVVQYTALTALERHPGMTAAALARHSFVAAQTTAELVRGLEERGLVVREPDPASRRQTRISLTAAGRSLLKELREPVAAIERAMVGERLDGRRVEVAGALEAMRRALESS